MNFQENIYIIFCVFVENAETKFKVFYRCEYQKENAVFGQTDEKQCDSFLIEKSS